MADAPNPIQIQRFLGGMDYPVSKDTILQTAKKEGADENVLDALGRDRVADRVVLLRSHRHPDRGLHPADGAVDRRLQRVLDQLSRAVGARPVQ